MTEPTTLALEEGAPFFLDGRRCAITETSPVRTRFAAEGFSGTCATAEIMYDADFGVFHLPGRLHRPVRTTAQGAITPAEG
jgi:hypothetical protein